MNASLEEKVLRIEELKKLHKSLLIEMVSADSGKLFSMDLLASAAIKRSASLCHAFTTLVCERNYCCAAVLVRLQIDSCLRFFAAFIVDDPSVFSEDVLKGVSIRNMKDSRGKKMTDSYLVNLLSEENPWIDRVYKATSGFIHLSEKHIHAAVSLADEENSLRIRISEIDEDVGAELWAEMAAAFVEATELLFHYLNGWICTKKSPQIVSRLKLITEA